MEDAGRRVTVLTGGAGGIALACARRLGEADVILLADRDAAALTTAAHELHEEGVDVQTAVVDVCADADVADLAAAATAIAPLHALVHTAGIAPPGATDPRRILEVNLDATVRLLDAFEPLAADGAVGVMIASLAGHRRLAQAPDARERATTPLAAYSVSKRGVIVEVQRRAAAWGARGARLLSVSPGLIADTGIGREAQAVVGGYARQSALGRAGTAADVAGLVRFLCSDDAAYMTGCDVLVDGGVLAAIERHGDDAARERWHAAS